jgi:sirohydrochlorin ferrochelatase
MDGQGQQVDVAARIREIQDHMPETYRAIKAMASGPAGSEAYAAVKRAIRGEANQFYAIESGFVVGAPFDLPDVTAELARHIVRFGCRHLVMWAPEVAMKGQGDGTH